MGGAADGATVVNDLEALMLEAWRILRAQLVALGSNNVLFTSGAQPGSEGAVET